MVSAMDGRTVGLVRNVIRIFGLRFFQFCFAVKLLLDEPILINTIKHLISQTQWNSDCKFGYLNLINDPFPHYSDRK